jgi:glycerol-3-phosphate dehydrogenase
MEQRLGSIQELGNRMNRPDMLSRVDARQGAWDLVIVGGGATGVGIAVDAASRGYEALLLEQSDFGKGTSSRSTKLVHGGVRYLEQGNISLVMEALERGLLRQNAPTREDLGFVVPNYEWWEAPFYDWPHVTTCCPADMDLVLDSVARRDTGAIARRSTKRRSVFRMDSSTF